MKVISNFRKSGRKCIWGYYDKGSPYQPHVHTFQSILVSLGVFVCVLPVITHNTVDKYPLNSRPCNLRHLGIKIIKVCDLCTEFRNITCIVVFFNLRVLLWGVQFLSNFFSKNVNVGFKRVSFLLHYSYDSTPFTHCC